MRKTQAKNVCCKIKMNGEISEGATDSDERQKKRRMKERKKEKLPAKIPFFSGKMGVRLRVNNSFNCVVFSDFVYNLMKRKISNHSLRDFRK